MGLTTFKELFGTVYGISPRAWISERRILYAHQLLLNGKMSIVDIAMEAGSRVSLISLKVIDVASDALKPSRLTK